jgi:hypothetical protein
MVSGASVLWSYKHIVEILLASAVVLRFGPPDAGETWMRIVIGHFAALTDHGQLKFRRGQLEFPGHRRGTAIQVGSDLYGDGLAGEAAMAADTDGVAGGGGSKSGHGSEDGAEVPAGSKTAERDATKAYVANAGGSLCGNMGRDRANVNPAVYHELWLH